MRAEAVRDCAPRDEGTSVVHDRQSGARFGAGGKSSPYRYELWREWDATRPSVAFAMLNPSTADATQDDPTIRRCIGYARAWGFGGVRVVNLFALRTPNPAELRRAKDPIGPGNDAAVRSVAARCPTVVAAWGTHGEYLARAGAVRALVSAITDLHCLRLTRDGHPWHPLYLPADLRPTVWVRRRG